MAFAVLVTLSLAGCADAIRDTFNDAAVATGCHLPRDADAEACQRLAAERQAQPAQP